MDTLLSLVALVVTGTQIFKLEVLNREFRDVSGERELITMLVEELSAIDAKMDIQ